MRQFAEELNIGSYEILLTLPLRFTDVVIGKFLASTAFVAGMLVPTLVYPVTVAFLGALDWGPVIGGYLGALLLGASFSAVGLFASALTRNQIVAFIIGMAICFGLTLVDQMVFFLPHALLKTLAYLAADVHFQNIAKGIVDTRDILYFLSVCFIGLYGTFLVLKAKN
jgi:ABC-2 type transport system permease protein